MTTITVEDPAGMIGELRVVHESGGAIVIYGDMNSPGKRAEVYALGDGKYSITSDPGRGEHIAAVSIHGLPNDVLEVVAEVSRYSLFIVMVSRSALAAGREAYRMPCTAG